MFLAQPSFLPEPSQGTDPVTPLMVQYLDIKQRHQDCLVFFRLGDFYELFFDDAVTAAKCLDIALTRRGQHQGQDIPMCGVPAHSYEGYLAKLIRAGHRVAICEQKESPDEAKKRAKSSGGKAIVTRDVVRIITPGTITEDSLLDARTTNYLACLTNVGEEIAIAWCDIVTGHIFVQTVASADMAGVLARLNPSEILVAQRILEKSELFDALLPWRSKYIAQPNGRFDSDNAKRRVMDIYHVRDIAAFGDFSRVEIAALGALLDYIELTQKTDLKHFARPQKSSSAQVAIDPATRRNLELVRTLSGDRQGSLLDAIDRTQTGAGARLLAMRLTSPLTDVGAIISRLDAVEFFVTTDMLRETVRAALRRTPDLERALARLALSRGGPRDLASVRDALKQADVMRKALLSAPAMPSDLRDELQNLGEHHNLVEQLHQALASDLPLLARDGNFIARGYSPALDELIVLRDDGRRLIAQLQQKYAIASGVQTLKIKHNQVIGYHIEVTPMQADKLLADKDTFIHRQTLATAARFTTIELSEMERKLTEAADKALAVELELFNKLVVEVTQQSAKLRQAAQSIASLDVSAALAELAVEQNYARPVVDSSLSFDIKSGRHPVVEQALRQQNSANTFIANQCDLNRSQYLWLLTGPNMAGKSTFLRQNALIALLAQIGSFVPAHSAHIGVIDRLFSRVGAADDLAAGRSTFMVEMVETAAILTQAGERALVILDEIGRGTSTYDGLSIAWAVLEHLHEINRCRALFATHYHELTALADRLPSLRRATMRIKEWDDKIIFLHEVVEGVADRSYGIHVAQMAGLPLSAIARAEQVLAGLENKKVAENKPSHDLNGYNKTAVPKPKQKTINQELEVILSKLDPDGLSPKEALEILYKIKAAYS
jgi:DNA mismatch repair protein MutS